MISNPAVGEVYSIQHYEIKFVSYLRQVGGFLRVLRFPPTNKTDHDITEIFVKVALNTIHPTITFLLVISFYKSYRSFKYCYFSPMFVVQYLLYDYFIKWQLILYLTRTFLLSSTIDRTFNHFDYMSNTAGV